MRRPRAGDLVVVVSWLIVILIWSVLAYVALRAGYGR